MSTSSSSSPARRTTVTAGGGADLSCIERNLEGGATPFLLVHGLASNARLWDGVADRLAAGGHPVVAVDQRGHGRSDKPGDGYDFATLTQDLMSVVKHYAWDKPLIAGQSWGANVVLEFAVRCPTVPLAIALVDGGTGDLADGFADWPTCEAALAPPELNGMSAVRFQSFIRNAHPAWPEQGIEGTLANVELLPDGSIRPWLSRDTHMVILRHLWEHRPSTRFAELDVPVLIVPARDESNHRWMQGKRDSVERASKLIPRSVVHWIDGDHDLHAQHPDVVARLFEAATRPEFFA